MLLLLLSALASVAQTRLPAFEMNQRLGRGINMGNSFEAPTEEAWGNPWKPEYFKIIAELGFDHVRLPVRWETSERSMEAAPYTISGVFLDRVQAVIDTARKYKLHIIINMHHHDVLFENPTLQKERFLSQWTQIAERFKDYPDSLLFEVLNEPHGNVTPALWNQYFAEALLEIRKTNPTRVVLMGVAEFGGLGGLPQLQLPNDEYIIVSPHYYNPFPFTHQGAEWVTGADQWLGTPWSDTEAERETVMSEFNYALHFSEVNHVPIHVGEFGAYSKADEVSRQRWTTFLARWFQEKNLSWAYWEFSAGFGIYIPATKQFNQTLADALLEDEVPPAKPVSSTPLYTSNFSSSTDGWSLSQQSGASATLTSSGGKLTVAISNGGNESWHLQLVKNSIRLEKDKLYKLSFTARASADKAIGFYSGKASSPWTAYSGTSAVVISSTSARYTSTFTMKSPTDPAARLVFDLGKNTGNVIIENVKVEELSFVITDIQDDHNASEAIVYPNPVKTQLTIKELYRYQVAELIDMRDLSIARFTIMQDKSGLDIAHVPAGMYILSLHGIGGSYNVKIVKE